MKPAPFEHIQAVTVDGAVAALREHGEVARVLAGGQSLVPLMNLRRVRPRVLVDINSVDELGRIEANGSLEIGARVRQSEALRSPEVRSLAPLVVDASAMSDTRRPGAAERSAGSSRTRIRSRSCRRYCWRSMRRSCSEARTGSAGSMPAISSPARSPPPPIPLSWSARSGFPGSLRAPAGASPRSRRGRSSACGGVARVHLPDDPRGAGARDRSHRNAVAGHRERCEGDGEGA